MNDKEVIKKLDEINRNLNRLMAIVAVSGKDEDRQIRGLSRVGFSSSEIEAIMGIPSRTIRDRLSRTRKRQ